MTGPVYHDEPSEGTEFHEEPKPYRNGFLRKLAMTAVIVSLLTAAGTTYLWFNIVKESKERRNQTCRVFESAHKQEVDDLNGAYRYLAKAPPPEQGTTLYKLVLSNLKKLELQAKSDQDQEGWIVPAYCDEPGVGLPEPDPKVPQRPAGLPLG